MKEINTKFPGPVLPSVDRLHKDFQMDVKKFGHSHMDSLIIMYLNSAFNLGKLVAKREIAKALKGEK